MCLFFSRCHGKMGLSLGLERCRGVGARATLQPAPTTDGNNATCHISCLTFSLHCCSKVGVSIGLKRHCQGHVQCGNLPRLLMATTQLVTFHVYLFLFTAAARWVCPSGLSVIGGGTCNVAMCHDGGGEGLLQHHPHRNCIVVTILLVVCPLHPSHNAMALSYVAMFRTAPGYARARWVCGWNT
jgi:hypothetical protein